MFCEFCVKKVRNHIHAITHNLSQKEKYIRFTWHHGFYKNIIIQQMLLKVKTQEEIVHKCKKNWQIFYAKMIKPTFTKGATRNEKCSHTNGNQYQDFEKPKSKEKGDNQCTCKHLIFSEKNTPKWLPHLFVFLYYRYFFFTPPPLKVKSMLSKLTLETPYLTNTLSCSIDAWY